MTHISTDPSRRVLIRLSSPDGMLTLIAEQLGDDVQIGFEGMPWHTHGDIVAELAGRPIPEAIERFVDGIACDKHVIALLRREGNLVDIWVSDDPDKDAKYAEPHEALEFRYWSGAQVIRPEGRER